MVDPRSLVPAVPIGIRSESAATLPVKVMLSAILSPKVTLPLAVNAPVIAVVALLMVAVPVAAPIFKVAAAPAKLIVVATVLNKSKEVDPVVMEVVMAGEVPKTTTPVPVSSDRELERAADAPETAKLEEPSVNKALDAVRPENVIVPEEERPVRPLATPAPVTSQTLELITTLSPPSPMLATPFRVVVPETVRPPVTSSFAVGAVFPIPTFPPGIMPKCWLVAVVICAKPAPVKAMFAPAPDMVKALPVCGVVNPEVAVIKPEIVGVAVQDVPVTVKSPPRVVRLLPETVRVPLTSSFAVGAVVPIPTLPALNQELLAPATLVPVSLINALDVAVAPINKSSVILTEDKALLFLCQYPEVPVAGE